MDRSLDTQDQKSARIKKKISTGSGANLIDYS